ncbi:hypothetical protein [Fructilactobacillus cliffordii]|uniref:Uncharacterized protein n=1 Tax=Fructilactobacillus cliffordii TaxID=2940299 RepID=A0A9Q9E161_9LACO|nr:hypothetical protein [Fructilactobacillus cliffordii]USS89856.1 hypothetical protein M3M40_03545 [Fructilactobacillus cliffordii]
MIFLFFVFPLLLLLAIISGFRSNCCGCLGTIFFLIILGFFITYFWLFAAFAIAGLMIYAAASYVNNQ